jgi:hypothetical protein
MEVTDLSIRTLRGALAAAVAGATLLAAVPAAQANKDAAAAGCTPQPASAHPFAPWDDFGLYTLVDGADMESGLAGWTTSGDAQVVEGNDPFLPGHQALALGAGASVTTARICIDDTYPWFRFFSRGRGKLRIEIVYTDSQGRERSEETGDYMTSDPEWAPSETIGIPVEFEHAGAAVQVAFRFTAQGRSNLEIDDIYVDPMARG